MKTRISPPRTISDFRRLGKAKLGGRSAQEAKALHDCRQQASRERRPSVSHFILQGNTGQYPANIAVIPLGCHDSGIKKDSRKRNWERDTASIERTQFMEINNGRYSSRCHYTHWTYRYNVECWGAIISPQKMYIRYTSEGKVKSRIIQAPRGWRWSINSRGIYIVDTSGKKDYHPTIYCLLQGVKYLTSQAKANYKKRTESIRKAREEKKFPQKLAALGVYLCLADGIASGSCQAGIKRWASSHGLDIKRHYLPQTILKFAEDEDQKRRAMAAMYCSLKRHERELAQGFCSIAQEPSIA